MDLKLPHNFKLVVPEDKKEETKKPGFFSGLFKTASNKKLNTYGQGLKLGFVVGHEQHAKGAFGVAPLSQYEYEWSTSLGKVIQRIAATKGVEVGIFLRDGVGIKGAHREANKWGAWAVVESHFNAYNAIAFGTETLCSNSQPGSHVFAAMVQRSMCEALGRKEMSRGVKKIGISDRGGLNVNLYPRTVLIEPFFGDNQKEAQLAIDKKEQLATSIVLSFLDFVAV